MAFYFFIVLFGDHFSGELTPLFLVQYSRYFFSVGGGGTASCARCLGAPQLALDAARPRSTSPRGDPPNGVSAQRVPGGVSVWGILSRHVGVGAHPAGVLATVRPQSASWWRCPRRVSVKARRGRNFGDVVPLAGALARGV